jgi:predicted mannosyl-3-phosphoglycerate phosphatase (HAD superfamily)
MFQLSDAAGEYGQARHRWPMVVVTPVNVFCDPKSGGLQPMVRQAVQVLIDADIPIILVASDGVREVQNIQCELGIIAPFLSGGGATLHVPDNYFAETQRDTGTSDWNTMPFGLPDAVRSPARGLRTLLEAYRRHRSDIVIIGFGLTWADRLLLGLADVAVIVRGRHIDQTTLRQTFPQAYVTLATGSLGWGEAILGQLAYERDETGMMGASWP